jgi:hypothetical protein
MKTINKANEILELIKARTPVADVRARVCSDDQDWSRASAKAYSLHLVDSRKERKKDEKSPHVSCASNDEIKEIIALNHKLADYALTVPTLATTPEFRSLQQLVIDMPQNEHKVISIIEACTMAPRIRALQKKGRLETFKIFKEFSRLIDAATLSYYRENYFSAYLTLVPVIEGILLRWLGFEGIGNKPEFEALRKFFRNSHIRQPCPGNPQFHEVYIKACDKIITEHLFKPSERGHAYSNFNRHLAAHLLSDSPFATRENCIRLFLLIDVMTEIYYYETCCKDHRFSLKSEEFAVDWQIYESLVQIQGLTLSPEKAMLGVAPQQQNP